LGGKNLRAISISRKFFIFLLGDFHAAVVKIMLLFEKQTG